MNYYDYGTREKRVDIRNIPFVTVALIVINAAIFMLLESKGSTEDFLLLYKYGAMYWPDVYNGGQWYRLITHMFLHSGSDHLFNNMFMLAVLGYNIEREYGRFKYLISYFICGIGGAVLSGLYDMKNCEYSISVGASGAIMGIFGIMLVMIFLESRRTGQVAAPRLVFVFVLMVFGNMQEGIDWVAHLGGAITGVILAALLYKRKVGDRR